MAIEHPRPYEFIKGTLDLEETKVYENGVMIYEGASVRTPEGKTFLMTQDGVVTQFAPGDYRGRIVLHVRPAIEKLGKTQLVNLFVPERPMEDVEWEHPYLPLIFVDTDEDGNTKIGDGLVLSDALLEGEADDAGVRGAKIRVKANLINGILVADGTYRIEDLDYESIGNGGDDFDLYGSVIAAGGHADVVVSNARIRTKGVIASSLNASEYAHLLVRDSDILTEGIPNDRWWPDAMTEVPWVLAMHGTVRSANLVGSANVVYYNTSIESNGWGVYSTDDTSIGAKEYMINSSALIRKDSFFGAGYGVYILLAVSNHLLGMEVDVPTCGVVIASTIDVESVIGASSQENLRRYLSDHPQFVREIGFEEVEERNSVIRSGRFGVLFHSTNEGSLKVLPGTRFETGDSVFMIKAERAEGPDGVSMPAGHCAIDVTGAQLVSQKRRILTLMENDDPGMGTEAHDRAWAPYYIIPEFPRIEALSEQELTAETEESLHAAFHDMEIDGDITNSRNTTLQNLFVTLDHVCLTGKVTSAVQRHAHLIPGDRITQENNDELGEIILTPAPATVNGVCLILQNGTRWSPDGTCYLNRLVIGDDCELNGSLSVDGVQVTAAAGEYTGRIVVEA